jgi:hypothetical protein
MRYQKDKFVSNIIRYVYNFNIGKSAQKYAEDPNLSIRVGGRETMEYLKSVPQTQMWPPNSRLRRSSKKLCQHVGNSRRWIIKFTVFLSGAGEGIEVRWWR